MNESASKNRLSILSKLLIGGFLPFTAIDYPGHLAAVIYTQGCNWACSYCHNATLRPQTKVSTAAWQEIEQTLTHRLGRLQAVVLSGGEPTLHGVLPDVASELKDLGYLVGLHTNGSKPDRLAACLPYLDWVGLDIKGPESRYISITGDISSFSLVEQSLDLLQTNLVAYEVRTTWSPRLFSLDELSAVGDYLNNRYIKQWIIQIMQPRQPDSSIPTEWLDAIRTKYPNLETLVR